MGNNFFRNNNKFMPPPLSVISSY